MGNKLNKAKSKQSAGGKDQTKSKVAPLPDKFWIKAFESAKDQSKSPLAIAFTRSKNMLRIELLQYLQTKDILNLAMTCKHIYKMIDCNKFTMLDNKAGGIEGTKNYSGHFQSVIKIQYPVVSSGTFTELKDIFMLTDYLKKSYPMMLRTVLAQIMMVKPQDFYCEEKKEEEKENEKLKEFDLA